MTVTKGSKHHPLCIKIPKWRLWQLWLVNTLSVLLYPGVFSDLQYDGYKHQSLCLFSTWFPLTNHTFALSATPATDLNHVNNTLPPTAPNVFAFDGNCTCVLSRLPRLRLWNLLIHASAQDATGTSHPAVQTRAVNKLYLHLPLHLSFTVQFLRTLLLTHSIMSFPINVRLLSNLLPIFMTICLEKWKEGAKQTRLIVAQAYEFLSFLPHPPPQCIQNLSSFRDQRGHFSSTGLTPPKPGRRLTDHPWFPALLKIFSGSTSIAQGALPVEHPTWSNHTSAFFLALHLFPTVLTTYNSIPTSSRHYTPLTPGFSHSRAPAELLLVATPPWTW